MSLTFLFPSKIAAHLIISVHRAQAPKCCTAGEKTVNRCNGRRAHNENVSVTADYKQQDVIKDLGLCWIKTAANWEK